MLAQVWTATCPTVCPSRAGIVSERRKLASWFLHHLSVCLSVCSAGVLSCSSPRWPWQYGEHVVYVRCLCVSREKVDQPRGLTLCVFLSSISMLLNQNSSNCPRYIHTVNFATSAQWCARVFFRPNSPSFSALVTRPLKMSSTKWPVLCRVGR